jgi:hypothetical protein
LRPLSCFCFATRTPISGGQNPSTRAVSKDPPWPVPAVVIDESKGQVERTVLLLSPVLAGVDVAMRYERKLWMRDLVKGVAYPPVDH